MNEHTDIMRVASMIQTYQQAYKHLKQMEIYEDMQEALDKIKRHEEYYMKHRQHKGLNIRKQSVQDPIKRANKIASVIAKLENNEKDGWIKASLTLLVKLTYHFFFQAE